MKDHKLYFKTIHVIESLKSGDYHTGRRLFEDLEPLAIANSPVVTAHFWSVQTREEFLARLRLIADDSRTHGQSPVLHIETHGSPDGIQVSSGECLTWLDLKAELTAINETSRLNLLVVLAACDGAKLYQIIQPTDRAPVFAVIGPNRTVTAGEIECATRVFYRKLFDVKGVVAAWQAMNEAVSLTQRTFSLYHAAWLLRLVMHHYLKTLCSEEALVEREGNVIAILQQKGLIGAALENARNFARERLRDHPSRFNEIKDHFFFCDLYPENVTRFDVTFEECLQDPVSA
ncbi:MAG: hypothetical protein A3H28_11430 [Acidobacteria bacterium RIFCSPLOWO2_02_FULL_61_28]|nr:MAG: hypothetical protein A3H28_11430 [Acidobacteria bacterium RIFCSPLOWO2_02_FULL_61_28]